MKSRLSEDRLVWFALSALEEAAAQAHVRPVHRSWALRLALAYLACLSTRATPADDWPFRVFWRSLPHPRDHDRWGNVNAALNGIYRTLGLQRDFDRVSEFEKQTQESSRS